MTNIRAKVGELFLTPRSGNNALSGEKIKGLQ